MKPHRLQSTLRLLPALLLAIGCTACAAPAVKTAPAAPAAAALSAPLPVDPAVRIVKLPNGLHVWLRHNATPPGHVTIYMHVGSGSLNETDEQRGLAHFLEHMAFEGSKHFPPGTLIKYFESLGLIFGADQNAFTSYDQTTFSLTLPKTDRETIDKGLLCMSDFAHREDLLPARIDKERKVVLQELRARSGAGQRVWDALVPVLLPGSRVAQRTPIGKAPIIEKAGRRQLLDYYRKWYRPDDTTLIIAGDADMDMVLDLVRRQFGDWKAVPNPPPNADPGVKPYTSVRAAVFTDPEVPQTEVDSDSVRPLEKLLTVGDFRRDLVDGLGEWMANRRFEQMVQNGTAPFQHAEVDKSPFLNACTLIEASASGAPDLWKPMMTSLLRELKRAREHGFLPEEFEQAKKELLARDQQNALTEATRDSSKLVSRMNSLVSQHRKPLSARQILNLTRSLIGGITLDEVNAAFRSNFEPDKRLLSVVMPKKKGLPVPTDSDVLAVAKQVAAARVAALPQRKAPKKLLAKEPAPGVIASQQEDKDLGVLSVTFDNGVRAHLRSMDFKKDQVFIAVTLAGGAIRETKDDRGVTDVAALAFNQPASRTLTSNDIQDLLTGKNISLRASVGKDAVTLSVTSATRDVEDAFRLIHLMLTQPRIEASALARWKQEASDAIAKRRIDVRARAAEEMASLLSGGDPRFAPLTQQDVDRLTLKEGQHWLDRLVQSGPIELAVVGDMDRARALQLTQEYLGSLSKRPVRDATLDALRKLSYKSGPLHATVGVPTITPTAMVLEGWRGADWTQVKDRRILQIVGEVLQSRLREQVREQHGFTYSPFAYMLPGQAYPGSGLFAITFTAAPKQAASAGEFAMDVARKLAKDGPTEQELKTVRKQFATSIITSQKEPTYWVAVMADMDYHGTVLDDVKNALKAYTSYTRRQMMDVMARYITPTRSIQVLAVPSESAGKSGENETKGNVEK